MCSRHTRSRRGEVPIVFCVEDRRKETRNLVHLVKLRARVVADRTTVTLTKYAVDKFKTLDEVHSCERHLFRRGVWFKIEGLEKTLSIGDREDHE